MGKVVRIETGRVGKAVRIEVLSFERPLVWLLPLIAMLVAFTIVPLFYNIWLSFHEYHPFSRELRYVGGENWRMLWEDERMWEALRTTLLYFVITLSIQVVLGMGIALLLDSEDWGFGFLRTLLMLTLVVPPAIAGMIFLLIEDPEFGVLTYVLETLGLLDKTQPILATASTALWGVMLVDVWQWTPFMVLIFLAGLRSLPPEPYEAAMLDGASSWMVFRRITLPLMQKVIAVAVLIRGIDIFRMFDYVFVMTSGGPGTSTYTLSLYSWQQTFSFVKWGYGATLSLVTLAIILVVANVFIWVAKVRW